MRISDWSSDVCSSDLRDIDGQLALVDIGHRAEVGDMKVGDGFEPYRLPDAADRGVPDAARFERLLAARLVAGRGRVGDLHDEFVGAGAQIAGDVEAERVRSTLKIGRASCWERVCQ